MTEEGALPRYDASAFAVDTRRAASEIGEGFKELRRFAAENTHAEDPLHQKRIKARLIIDSPEFRNLDAKLKNLATRLTELEKGASS